MPKKILVVDDHHLIRMGISQTLGKIPDVKVIGEAEDGESAIENTRKLKPDVVFMDIKMPGIGGLEATRRILAAEQRVKIIVVSAFADDVYPSALLNAGAAGYITKNADADEIAAAISSVLSDNVYVSPVLAQAMVRTQLNTKVETSPFSQLSGRELQVTELITKGKRPQEIADQLNVSPKTINTYKQRVFEKVGVSNDVELTLFAVRFNLVDPFDII